MRRLFYTTSYHCWGQGKGTLFWGGGVPAGQENMMEWAVQCFLLSGSFSVWIIYFLICFVINIAVVTLCFLAVSHKFFLSLLMVFGASNWREKRKWCMVLVEVLYWRIRFLNHHISPSCSLGIFLLLYSSHFLHPLLVPHFATP